MRKPQRCLRNKIPGGSMLRAAAAPSGYAKCNRRSDWGGLFYGQELREEAASSPQSRNAWPFKIVTSHNRSSAVRFRRTASIPALHRIVRQEWSPGYSAQFGEEGRSLPIGPPVAQPYFELDTNHSNAHKNCPALRRCHVPCPGRIWGAGYADVRYLAGGGIRSHKGRGRMRCRLLSRASRRLRSCW